MGCDFCNDGSLPLGGSVLIFIILADGVGK